MSVPESAGPLLRVVRGEPTPEELAAVAAVVTAVAASAPAASAPRVVRGRWNDPVVRHRRTWLFGPGAWRSTFWT